MFYKGNVQNSLPLFDNLFSPSIVDIFGGEKTDVGMVMIVIVPAEETLAEEPRASWAQPNRRGNSGRYFRVLNWDSE